jgi:hypothetical protein
LLGRGAHRHGHSVRVGRSLHGARRRRVPTMESGYADRS